MWKSLELEIEELRQDKVLVSMSGDIWGENGISLFAVLLHWISPEWTLETRLAMCEPYSDVSHTADNIFNTTKKKLLELGVGREVTKPDGTKYDTFMESIFAKVVAQPRSIYILVCYACHVKLCGN